ncbi:nucleoside triphosphate pyrophosphohydrolase [Serratia fonticola]|uniref:Nucleoside triphosphate pyrophosphohydrolase n=1 Tax=Serratia fonticola TaxID=47917 RepID=A0A4U9UPX3_SERFO|nr:nucleoside triphosphate pyrophosphohydrolase [Serratia fonticola]
MKHLNIAVGIIRNPQQEIFITRRAGGFAYGRLLGIPWRQD